MRLARTLGGRVAESPFARGCSLRAADVCSWAEVLTRLRLARKEPHLLERVRFEVFSMSFAKKAHENALHVGDARLRLNVLGQEKSDLTERFRRGERHEREIVGRHGLVLTREVESERIVERHAVARCSGEAKQHARIRRAHAHVGQWCIAKQPFEHLRHLLEGVHRARPIGELAALERVATCQRGIASADDADLRRDGGIEDEVRVGEDFRQGVGMEVDEAQIRPVG